MKHYFLQFKQFHFVDSMLFGQVILLTGSFFSGAVRMFFKQRWLSPPIRKIIPCAKCETVSPYCGSTPDTLYRLALHACWVLKYFMLQ